MDGVTPRALVRELLVAFASLIETESRLVEARRGTRIEWCEQIETRVEYGPKWARVDRSLTNGQWCGYLMVDLTTQEIVGIKGYGRPHLGHRYGTLQTIREWEWGSNHPARKATKMTPDEASAFVVEKMDDADEDDRREASVRMGWETIHGEVKA